MKIKLVITASLLALISFGQTEFPIYDQVSFIDEYDKSVKKDNQLLIESPFAKQDLEDKSDFDWSKKKVRKVYYLYSKNNSNPSFEQNDLSNKRYINLISQFPHLGNSEIEWETIVQSGCKNDDCAKKLFHGFIVEYDQEETIVKAPIQPAIGHDQIEKQIFRIDPRKENVITGREGTKVLIPANAFVDSRGNIVSKRISITLKEALDIESIVLGDLNTMTTDGEILQSKGMVEIRALKGDKELELDKNKSLTVSIPNSYEDGYSYFEGKEDGKKLSWQNPLPVNANNEVRPRNEGNFEAWGWKYSNIPFAEGYKSKGNLDSIKVNYWNRSEMVTQASMEKRRNIQGVNGVVQRLLRKWFKENEVDLKDLDHKYYSTHVTGVWWFGRLFNRFRHWNGKISKWIPDNSREAYIFSMTKTGWANIDCLAHFKNAKKIRFTVDVQNKGAYEDFAIRMIVPDINCMVPGFQKKNGTYSFTHGEYEDKARMPIGKIVYVMAQGVKNSEQYFGIQSFKLGDKDVNPMSMKVTTQDKMIDEIKETF